MPLDPAAFFGDLKNFASARLSLVLWLGTLAFMSVGFGFTTPAKRLHQLEQSDSAFAVSTRLRFEDMHRTTDSLRVGQEGQRQLLEGLTRLSCFKEDPRLIRLAGLPCSQVLSP